MVFTTRLSGGKGGRNGLKHELRRLGMRQKNGKPNHPQTQGKVGASGAVRTDDRSDRTCRLTAPAAGWIL
jgi:hypothetical protein